MSPFYVWGSTTLTLQSHYEEAVYFLPQIPGIDRSGSMKDWVGIGAIQWF